MVLKLKCNTIFLQRSVPLLLSLSLSLSALSLLFLVWLSVNFIQGFLVFKDVSGNTAIIDPYSHVQSNSHTTHTSNRIQCIFISWLLFYLILECVSLIMESISILYFNWLPFGRNNLRDASYKLLGWMIVQWYLHSLYFDGNCLNFFIFIWYLVRRDINKKSLNKFSYQI